MNKCKKCNVVILDDTDRCPLCKHVLESDGIPGESRYPDAIATARKFRFVENLVLFISIVAECLLIAINFQVDREVAWSIDLALFILILVNRRNWQSYMMSELLTILLSIVPVVLLQMRIIHFPYLAWGSLGVSVFLFLGTLILGDQRARTELKRRFHIWQCLT